MSVTHFDFNDLPGNAKKKQNPESVTYRIKRVVVNPNCGHLVDIYFVGQSKPFMPRPDCLYKMVDLWGDNVDLWTGEQLILQKTKFSEVKVDDEKNQSGQPFTHFIKATPVGGNTNDQ